MLEKVPTELKSKPTLAKKTYSKAILTDEGIVIKSQFNEDLFNQKLHSRSHAKIIDEDTAECDMDTENDYDMFETASLISCVTCLTDNYSTLSATTVTTNTMDRQFSSVNGKFPANTVIPYGRILHAKYLDRYKGRNSAGSLPRRNSKGRLGSIEESLLNIEEDEDLVKTTAVNGISNNESFDPDLFDKGYIDDEYHDGQNFIEITFAKPRRQDVVPKRITLEIEDSLLLGNGIVSEILEKSYKGTKRNRNMLVIINPYGGKGKAKKLFMSKCQPILLASRCTVDIEYTEFTGHAIQIATNMDVDKYDTIACASGDGIPFEVINGLYQRKDRVKAFNKIAVTELPCGSGNAMSVSCHWTDNPSYAALSIVKSVESRVDIMCCSQPSYANNIPRLSFLSQTYGVIAESDINTEFIRWIGAARFEIGVAFNILQRKKYPCDIFVKYAAKSKNDLKIHFLEHTNRGSLRFEQDANQLNDSYFDTIEVKNITEADFKLKYPFDEGVPEDWERIDPKISNNLGIFYTGNMPYIAADTKFFPAALPSDGTMDMVITDARTAVTRMVPILLALDKGTHVLQPEVLHSKVLAYKLVPKVSSSVFSVDGEKFPLEPLQVEVLPSLCKTLLRNGRFVETEFDSM